MTIFYIINIIACESNTKEDAVTEPSEEVVEPSQEIMEPNSEPSSEVTEPSEEQPSEEIVPEIISILGARVTDRSTPETGNGNGGVLQVDLTTISDISVDETVIYQWFANGNEIDGAVDETITLADFEVENESIHVEVSYVNTDGLERFALSYPIETGNWRIHSGGEDGTVAGKNPIPFWETYSFDGSSRTHDGSGYEGRYRASETHSITSVRADEVGITTREGEHVLQFFGGTESKRVELGNRNWNTRVQHNQGVYVSASLYLPNEEWDPITQYSTIIFQHKQYPGADPNFEIRLSNEGDYKLFVRSPYEHYELTGQRHDDYHIATLLPNTWHDIKIYLKPSQNETEGQINIYVDGANVFEGVGTNLNDTDDTNDSFLKLGMYTNIEDDRIMYFDAIEMATFVDTDIDTWLSLPITE